MASGVLGVPEPVDEDYLSRRVKAIERRVDELGPSLMLGVADAIKSVVVQRSGYNGTDTFAVTTTPTTRASFTVTVPPGCVDGAYMATGNFGAINSTASPQGIYARVYATAPGGYAAWGARQAAVLGAGNGGTVTANLIREYDVVLTPGTLVTFYLEVHADAALASNLANFAFTEALVTFTR